MVYSSRETANVAFWQDRLRRAKHPIHAIGIGFDWNWIDSIHLKILFQHYKQGEKVLDVACGIGRTAYWFRDEDYVGFDFVPEFIDIAKKENPGKDFRVLDIREKLPFKKHEFDLAVLVSVKKPLEVNMQEEWPSIEKELKRVAKKVLVLEYGNNDPVEIHKYAEIL